MSLYSVPSVELPDPWPADDERGPACTCLGEFGDNPADEACEVHGPDEPPVCSNGDADCAAAEDNWCCPACWSDRRDDAAIERADSIRKGEW